MISHGTARRFFLFLLFILAFTIPVEADEISLYPGDSIQAAIDAATPGTSILLHRGDYHENLIIEKDITLRGVSYARVTLYGSVTCKAASPELVDLTVRFSQEASTTYMNSYYASLPVHARAGILLIDSSAIITTCHIFPDLEALNTISGTPGTLTQYGYGIQAFSLYGSSRMSPVVSRCAVSATECAVYYYAHASGGDIAGSLRNNTFYRNATGVLLRMHKENPEIYNNIFYGCDNAAVLFSYEDGPLYAGRQSRIHHNLFYEFAREGWNDAGQVPFALVDGRGNISADPGFIDPDGGIFYLSSEQSACIGAGFGGETIGACEEDLEDPVVSDIVPSANRVIGTPIPLVTGSVSDDTAVACVTVRGCQATLAGSTFYLNNVPVNYGPSTVTIAATDVAGKTTARLKFVYVYHEPVPAPAD